MYDVRSIFTETIEKIGYQPLHEQLEKFGGWPLIDPNWNEDEFNFMKLLSDLRMVNNKYFVNGYVTVDYKNSSNHIFKVSVTIKLYSVVGLNWFPHKVKHQ